MGPFEVERQRDRKQRLERLAREPGLDPQTARIWQRLADEVTFDEAEYNRRCVQVYSGLVRDRLF